MNFPIYSIGHGNRNIESFFSLLKKYQIDFLIDVRSTPFSKFHSHFNRENLEIYSKTQNIRYVFMGENLGGRPKDRSCYDHEGHVLYEKISEKSFFIEGVNRLKVAYEKNLRVACMCSELNPCDCHRSKLIGESLYKSNIEMVHIDGKGKLQNQSEVINQLTGGMSVDIFGDVMEFKSRGKY